mmetsp:Transcript_64639/g.168078  ORF Transcript_64639/g.168078 Transcript_64639/m.168078 type:complete len:387 (+) Transcript_64639:2265-3425(+)
MSNCTTGTSGEMSRIVCRFSEVATKQSLSSIISAVPREGSLVLVKCTRLRSRSTSSTVHVFSAVTRPLERQAPSNPLGLVVNKTMAFGSLCRKARSHVMMAALCCAASSKPSKIIKRCLSRLTTWTLSPKKVQRAHSSNKRGKSAACIFSAVRASSARGTRTGSNFFLSAPPIPTSIKSTTCRTKARLKTDLPLPAGATNKMRLFKPSSSARAVCSAHMLCAMASAGTTVFSSRLGVAMRILSSTSFSLAPVIGFMDTAKVPIKEVKLMTQVRNLACTAAKPPRASSIARSIMTPSALTEHCAVCTLMPCNFSSTALWTALFSTELRLISPSGQKRRKGIFNSAQRQASKTHHFLSSGFASMSKATKASLSSRASHEPVPRALSAT